MTGSYCLVHSISALRAKSNPEETPKGLSICKNVAHGKKKKKVMSMYKNCLYYLSQRRRRRSAVIDRWFHRTRYLMTSTVCSPLGIACILLSLQCSWIAEISSGKSWPSISKSSHLNHFKSVLVLCDEQRLSRRERQRHNRGLVVTKAGSDWRLKTTKVDQEKETTVAAAKEAWMQEKWQFYQKCMAFSYPKKISTRHWRLFIKFNISIAARHRTVGFCCCFRF